MPRGTIVVLLAGALLLVGSARAEDEQTTIAEVDPLAAPSETGPGAARLEEVLVEGHRPMSAASSQEIRARDFASARTRPSSDPQQRARPRRRAAPGRRQGGAVPDPRLRRRPRHRLRRVRPTAAGQHGHARPRPGLRRPQLPHPRDDRAPAALQGAVLRRSSATSRPPARSSSSPRTSSRRTSRSPRAARSTPSATSLGASPTIGNVKTLLRGAGLLQQRPVREPAEPPALQRRRQDHARPDAGLARSSARS